MKNSSILIATNLNVWSLSKSSGAPSFFKTLELYNKKKHNIYLYSTEAINPVPELNNVVFIKLPKLSSWNKPILSNIKRILNYILNQFIFLYTFIRSKHEIDLLYAYEIEFVPALKLISYFKKIQLITRFQGTILYPHMDSALWQLRFFPHYLSLKIKSHLTIMTNDGTKGDLVLSTLRAKDKSNIIFLMNGVDKHIINRANVSVNIINIVGSRLKYNFITVSRLEKWKRVDRSIEVFRQVHQELPESRLLIVGDGPLSAHLLSIVKKSGIHDSVTFLGSVNRDEVNYLMANSDIFLSHYDLSNLGNPLLEAMYNKCLVVTINNGDTNMVIKDGINGIMSDQFNYLDNAKKILNVINCKLKDKIVNNSYDTFSNLVLTWDERMELEYSSVIEIIKSASKQTSD
ncbi:glycosyltransferase family 4 protein [Trichlorobacter lovleyi]|uniref:Glycosyl transferase group 1 n=1 Tax=Trichlorobacter lovleyi (strain ATCC BAA-1151 / DSM 17278 / SZ) TaxID=398767 RepID=B3E8U8_TRIL1|nr:glycosyltransferase family 4 protein [Trichlorobacter lovleyi]ACD95216.1 glycosyl transferase group 1 [Trichlorobacter lovleyi SZ]